MAIIQVKDLVKIYKVIEKEDGLLGYFKRLIKLQYKEFTAAKNVKFNIKKSELVGIQGKMGVGKSTTIKILTCSYNIWKYNNKWHNT